MKRILLLLLPALLLFGCYKKSTEIPKTETVITTPDEPMKKLAWDAAVRIEGGLADTNIRSLQILDLNNQASLPPQAMEYFKTTFIRQLADRKFSISEDADSKLSGQLLQRNDRLVFAFTIQSDASPIFVDSSSIPVDERLANTLAQFKKEEPPASKHMHHAERKIPTPLMEIQQKPLDVASFCKEEKSNCFLVVLFEDRLAIRNWVDGTDTNVSLPPPSIYSRASAGKILVGDGTITLLTTIHAAPLRYDENFKQIPATVTPLMPLAEKGMNTFVLADGRFFDFDFVRANLFVAVTTDHVLNLAEKGSLAVSDRMVGASVAASLPAIYTSSPSLPGQSDAVLKFSYEEGRLQYSSTRPMDGEILGLAISDLNQDLQQELLITLLTKRGIFIEVADLF